MGELCLMPDGGHYERQKIPPARYGPHYLKIMTSTITDKPNNKDSQLLVSFVFFLNSQLEEMPATVCTCNPVNFFVFPLYMTKPIIIIMVSFRLRIWSFEGEFGVVKMGALIWVLACAMALGFAGGDGGDSNTVPALPVVEQQQNQNNANCPLDLSDELFGGVEDACGDGKSLDRSRCCPVLAAWLYAAHARTALQPSAAPPLSSSAAQQPVLPDDSQACVNSLQASLATRGIHIPRPNATCDAILCFCGIRLHQLTSLTCPTAFNVSLEHHNGSAPTSAVRVLATNCTDPSFQGCTQCLRALDKLKGGQGRKGGISERTSRMYNRDCELMGLTWLLAKNKTAYIPTVSAVLRAVMYTDHPLREYQCSPDQENMPLAVDSVELQQSAATMPLPFPLLPLLLLLLPCLKGF